MLTTLKTITDYADCGAHIQTLPKALQRAAMAGLEQFHALPMPTKKEERWRFADLTGLTLEGYHLPEKPTEAVIQNVRARSHLIETYSGELILVDGHCVFSAACNADLEKFGVIFCSIEEAAINHPELFSEYYFARENTLGATKMQALHKAWGGAGAFIYIPENVRLEHPLVTYHWVDADCAAIFPHTLLIAGKNASAAVVDVYRSAHENRKALSCGIAHHFASAGANVLRKSVQALGPQVASFQTDVSALQEEAQLHTAALHLGGYRARFENQAYLEGARSKAMLSSLTVATGDEQFDQRSFQHHRAPEATSDLLYKNALLGDSRTLFSGMILVDPLAQKTDAYQTNRNLLLSPTAEAVALPGLEIEANDVKCSHGATTSELDPAELFYLRTRGIPLAQARELLVQGFFEEVLSRIEYPELVENLRAMIAAKLLK